MKNQISILTNPENTNPNLFPYVRCQVVAVCLVFFLHEPFALVSLPGCTSQTILSLNRSKRSWMNKGAILACFQISLLLHRGYLTALVCVHDYKVSLHFLRFSLRIWTLWSYRILCASQQNWDRKNEQVDKGACNFQWMVRTQCNFTIVFWWHFLFPESGSCVCTMVPVTLFYPQEDLDPCLRGALLQAILDVKMRGFFCFHLLESLES